MSLIFRAIRTKLFVALIMVNGCQGELIDSTPQNADNWRPKGPHVKIVDSGHTIMTRYLPHSHEQPTNPVPGKDRCAIPRGAILPIQAPPVNAGNFYQINLREFLDRCQFSRGYLWYQHVADFKTSIGHRIKGDGVPIRNDQGSVIGTGIPNQFLMRVDGVKSFNGQKSFRYKFVQASGKKGHQPGVGAGFFGWVANHHVAEIIERGTPAPRHTEKPTVRNGHLTRKEKAFLDMIAWAEGTGSSYNVIYTFEYFQNGYRDHPRALYCSYGLCSDAAGRYQFLSTTWDNVAKAGNFSNFSPQNQDRGALILCNWRGVDPNHIKDFSSFKSAVWNVNLEWASLPGSPYGQKTRSMNAAWQVYQESLQANQ